MRSARTTKTGAYTFTGLPAGDYCVAAIKEEAYGQWQDPQVLEELSRRGSQVRLGTVKRRRRTSRRLAVRGESGDRVHRSRRRHRAGRISADARCCDARPPAPRRSAAACSPTRSRRGRFGARAVMINSSDRTVGRTVVTGRRRTVPGARSSGGPL
jgi:hypothetical protein